MDANQIKEHFPTGTNNDSLADLVYGNRLFIRTQANQFEPQMPGAVVDSCGYMSGVRAHAIRTLGKIFDLSARGIGYSPQHLASVAYPFDHFKDAHGRSSATVLETLVHSCVRDGLCRDFGDDYAREALETINAVRALNPRSWNEGVQIVDMPRSQEVCFADTLHARQMSMRFLSYSDTIHRLVRDGHLLMAEAFYDNATGRISYSSFLCSNQTGLEVPKDALTRIALGQDVGNLADMHPALVNLNSLVIGNNAHVFNLTQEKRVPTEFVVFGCADSRASPDIVFRAPYGMIEVLRNAGNTVDDGTVQSIVISAEDALCSRERVTVVVFAHSQCGAVTATLGQHKQNGGARLAATDNLAGPILNQLAPRFKIYLAEHLEPSASDPQLIHAAEANAVAAAYEIATYHSTHGDALRKLMRDGHVQIVPARYILTTGVVQFFDPIPAPIF